MAPISSTANMKLRGAIADRHMTGRRPGIARTSQVMRCEIGRLSQRETRPSLGLPVARTTSQAVGRSGAGPSPRAIVTRAGPRSRSISAIVPGASGAPSPTRRRTPFAPSSASALTARRRGDAGDRTVGVGRGSESGDGRPGFFASQHGVLNARATEPLSLFEKGGRIMARRTPPTFGPRPARASFRTRSTSISTTRSRRGWRGCCGRPASRPTWSR